MILQFFVTDDEIRAFFEECGYACEVGKSGYWQKVSHGSSEWVETERLNVKAGSIELPAAELLEQAVKARLLNPGFSAKTAIKKTIKKLNKYGS